MHGGGHAAEDEVKYNHLGTPLSWGRNEKPAKWRALQTDPREVTQMVTSRIEHNGKTPAKQGSGAVTPEPNKISASTPFDFSGKSMTPYGGLLPVATMLEKLGFQALMEETVTVKRR